MPTIRSLFFAPANRPDLVAKFPRFAADCYVIDLEDGTPPADKAAALCIASRLKPADPLAFADYFEDRYRLDKSAQRMCT